MENGQEIIIGSASCAALLVAKGCRLLGMRPSQKREDFFDFVLDANGNRPEMMSLLEQFFWSNEPLLIDVRKYQSAFRQVSNALKDAKAGMP